MAHPSTSNRYSALLDPARERFVMPEKHGNVSAFTAVDTPAPARLGKRVIKPNPAYGNSDDDTHSAGSERVGSDDEDEETRRVTVWNPKTGKKLSGNAGVFKKNLAKYLRTHPDWVVWTGQDKEGSPKRKRGPSNYEQALKRKRMEPFDLDGAGKIHVSLSLEDNLPTTQVLWSSLLAVCSEKAILAEVEERDSEDEEQGVAWSKGMHYNRGFHAVLSPSGLTSQAVG